MSPSGVYSHSPVPVVEAERASLPEQMLRPYLSALEESAARRAYHEQRVQELGPLVASLGREGYLGGVTTWGAGASARWLIAERGPELGGQGMPPGDQLRRGLALDAAGGIHPVRRAVSSSTAPQIPLLVLALAGILGIGRTFWAVDTGADLGTTATSAVLQGVMALLMSAVWAWWGSRWREDPTPVVFGTADTARAVAVLETLAARNVVPPAQP